jgi:hypothetical protein
MPCLRSHIKLEDSNHGIDLQGTALYDVFHHCPLSLSPWEGRGACWRRLQADEMDTSQDVKANLSG